MPAKFTDNQGTEWKIQLDPPLVKKIAEVSGVKLTDQKVDPFIKLNDDPILLVDVIYLICEKEATKNGISPDDFGARIGGCIDPAVAALQAAIGELFPSSKARAVD